MDDRPKRPKELEIYFEYAQGDIELSACAYCKNKLPKGATCKAFPDGDGIPEEILMRKNDHLEPFEGDNGIQFEARDGWEIPKRLER